MSRGLRRLGAAVVIVGSLPGCGDLTGPQLVGDNEVYLYFPAARLELPEPSQKWFGISVGGASGPAYLLTDNQLGEEPQLDSARRESYGETAARIDLQPFRRVSLSAVISESDTEADDGLVSGRLKVNAIYPQRTGERFSLSLTATRGEGMRAFDVHYTCGFDFSCTPLNARTEIDQTMTDGALVFGYELSRWWLLYGGPYYRLVEYEGFHQADRGDAPDVQTQFGGRAHMAGVNVGIALRAFNWSRFIVEGSAGRVEAGPQSDGFIHVGVAQEFYFGPRSGPTDSP